MEGFFVAGSFDSLSAVELSNAISGAVNVKLPGTLVFDYPSVKALAAYVHSLLLPSTSTALRKFSLANQPSLLTAFQQPGTDSLIQVPYLKLSCLKPAGSGTHLC